MSTGDMGTGERGREEQKAGVVDLAVGLSRLLRPWLIGLVVVGAVSVILALGANRPADPTFVDAAGTSTTSGVTFSERRIMVGGECLRVEVADTPERRAQGLKHRDGLGEYDGMYFVFDSTARRAFTMSEVRFPLTIGFYDDAGVRVDAQDMEPCPEGTEECPLYESKEPFRSALEVARGQLPDGVLVPTCPS